MRGDDFSEDRSGERVSRVEDHTVASRQRLRDRLNAEVAEFLARGGEIEVLDASISAEILNRSGGGFNSQPL